MLQQGLHVTIPFKDEALRLIVVEVQLILQRSRISRSNHLHALRHDTLEFLKLAIMNLQSAYPLDLIHWLVWSGGGPRLPRSPRPGASQRATPSCQATRSPTADRPGTPTRRRSR